MLKDEEYTYNENEAGYYSEGFQQYLKKRYYKNFAKKLIASATSVKSALKGESRIFGQFIPHGAVSHRMTCHRINLQGIPKIFKNHGVYRSDTVKIYSLDVSGQDIAIAANLAKKLYNDYKKFPAEYHKDMGELLNKLQEITLPKLKGEPGENYNNSRPLDYVTNEFIRLFFNKIPSRAINEDFRKGIKGITYTIFYGGGEKTAAKGFVGNKGFRTAFTGILVRRVSGVRRKVPFIDAVLESTGVNVKELHDEWARKKNETNEQFEERRRKYYEKFNELAVEEIIRIIKREYPGILEAQDYLKLYCVEMLYDKSRGVKKGKRIMRTYPTLLGWTTPLSGAYRDPKLDTKSKSYPIQASGAEFVRQWIIELNRIISKNKLKMKIINVIHDQMVVETSENKEERVVEHYMKKASRHACKKLGIEEGTIRFGKIEELSKKKEN